MVAIRRSKDPTAFAVLLEDSAAFAGLLVAAIGVAATVWLDEPAADGAASVLIGLLLVATAMILARETHSLMTGESAAPGVMASVKALLAADPRVTNVGEAMSLHLGPSEVLIAVTLNLRSDLCVKDIKRTALDLRARIEACGPIISHVFFRLARSIEADSRAVRDRAGSARQS